MAAITFNGTGNWSDGTKWSGGVTPVGGAAGDTCTIAAGAVCTLDNTSAACLSLVLATGSGANAGGKLQPSTTANSKITVHNGITSNGTSWSGAGGAYTSYFNFDMASAAGFTCEVVLNNGNTAGTGFGLMLNGNWQLKGAPKKRHTTLVSGISAAATSATVADATGWVVGDRIVFASTSAYSGTPATDEVTLVTVNTGTGEITWSGGTTNAHAAGCPVGNFSSNLIIRPGTTGGVAYVGVSPVVIGHVSTTCYCADVEFRGIAGSSTFGLTAAFCLDNAPTTNVASVSNNVFYDFRSSALWMRGVNSQVTRQNNIFYSANSTAFIVTGQDTAGTAYIGPDEDYAVFRAGNGINVLYPWQDQKRHKISGMTGTGSLSRGAVVSTARVDIAVDDVQVWSSNYGVVNAASLTMARCGFGSKVFSGCDNTENIRNGSGAIVATDCLFPATEAFTGFSTALPKAKVALINRDADTAVQEIYGSHSNTVPMVERDASTASRSNAAVLMTCNATTAIEQSFQVLAKAGQTIRLIGLVRKSASPAYGASTLPKITVSGLGITPVVATMSSGTAADTWETLTLDATNGGSSDGLLTVTFTAQTATAGAKAWFAGLPCAPFVTRARHYGYLFDETNPVRVSDPTSGAALASPVSEATAAAYTGMTITWGATSSVSLSADQTFQKLYDYSCAQGCLNISSAMPVAGSGTAGAPSLFAQGNLTATGYTLNGAGSISMGAYTLTATGYSYTGGAFSQAAATPSFAGGALTLTTKVTTGGAFSLSGGTIKFGAAGTDWNLSSATYSGTITLATTAGQAVTVSMPTPSGFTIVNSEPGNITVTAPSVSVTAAWADVEDGTTVLLYNDSAAGALIDTATVSGGAGYSKTFLLPHPDVAVGDSLRIRHGHKQYYAGEILGQMTSTGWAALATQTLHPVYAAWGLDGATYDQANGGPFTMDGVNLQVDIASGATTGLKTQLAAWTQYLMTLPAGLDAFYGAWDLLSQNQIRQNVSVVDVKIDVPTAGALFTFTDNNVNYYRSDFTFPGNVQAGHGLIAMTYNAEPFVATVTGGNVITGSVSEVAGLVLAAAAISPIAANVEKVHGHSVTGSGSAIDPWGPA